MKDALQSGKAALAGLGEGAKAFAKSRVKRLETEFALQFGV
jgi:hypothetical protein